MPGDEGTKELGVGGLGGGVTERTLVPEVNFVCSQCGVIDHDILPDRRVGDVLEDLREYHQRDFEGEEENHQITAGLKDKTPPQKRIFEQIGQEKPDLGELGGALFDFSRALYEGVGDFGPRIDALERKWREQSNNGLNPEGLRDAMAKKMQEMLMAMAEIRKPGDYFTYYEPFGNGIVRVYFFITEEGRVKADLQGYGGVEQVKNNFERMKGE